MAGFIFTGAASGDFKAVANRSALCELTSLAEITFMNQTHSDRVHVITAAAASGIDGDAIITTSKGLGLAVLAADCLPIVLLSPTVVGAVHAGRIGVGSDLITKTVRAMREEGATEIRAVIGPAICAECYEVSPEMYEEFLAIRQQAATSRQRHALDLKEAARAILEELDVQVDDSGICTKENPYYFSYRKDATAHRNVGVVWL